MLIVIVDQADVASNEPKSNVFKTHYESAGRMETVGHRQGGQRFPFLGRDSGTHVPQAFPFHLRLPRFPIDELRISEVVLILSLWKTTASILRCSQNLPK